MSSRNYGPTLNGMPALLAMPASLVYTRPSHLVVGPDHIPMPLYLADTVATEFPDLPVEVVREEYEVAERGRRY